MPGPMPSIEEILVRPIIKMTSSLQRSTNLNIFQKGEGVAGSRAFFVRLAADVTASQL